jgi:hypothetical protein
MEIVQDQLLENAWFYFQQLGDGKLASLTDLLREYDDLSDHKIELNHSTSPSKENDLKKIHERLKSLPLELRGKIENDRQVQSEALSAVRQKMEIYEYSAESVPFELFQNSDDAAVELADMLGTETPGATRRIDFLLDNESLSVMHWGRPINEFCRGDFSADRGRQREYDKDLKKMLILSASAKGQRAELVTGKFGLGFKSVFFLTDRPQIMSGTLAFEVIGGFFPRQLTGEQIRQLQTLGGREATSRVESTILRFPLVEGAAEKSNESILAFAELFPVTLFFSRYLKEANLTVDSQSWPFIHHELPLDIGGLAMRCTVSCERRSSTLADKQFIKLSGGTAGTVLLAVDAKGFDTIPNHVPTFWVDAPTRTQLNAGVVVQGQFAVDVGRNQLAKSMANHETAAMIGRAIGKSLVTLFDVTTNWGEFREALMLSHDAEPSEFWYSLWELLTASQIRSDSLLKIIFFGQEYGIRYLVRERQALPTGLPKPFDGLTSTLTVRSRVVGLIDKDKEGLARTLAWPGINRKWKQGELVSGDRVAVALYPSPSKADEAAPAISLIDFVNTVIDDAFEVDPESANRLGEVITSRQLSIWESQKEHSKEVDKLRNYLHDLRFRSRDQGCRVAHDLLAEQCGRDEALRAAFAPADRALHRSYDGPALEFFLVCRGDREAPATLLADWALRAEHSDARIAVLRYILCGKLDISYHLNANNLPDWLDNVPKVLLDSFTEQEQLQIRAKLGLGMTRLRDSVRAEILREREFEEPAVSVVSDPQSALEQIYEWWETEHETEIARLDTKLYPEGRFFELSHHAPGTAEERQEWLKLFLLGSLQTIGWTSPETNRNFLVECIDREWLQELANYPSRPGLWLESLMAHADAQETEIKYFQWMKHLVGLAIINEHLDEYVELFLAVDRIQQKFSLESVTTPRTSAFFQGGGPDAPPISAVLGIGQFFIMRELTRHGVLKNENVYPHCYVAFERTRRVVTSLGGPQFDQRDKRWDRSRSIHEFLYKLLGDRSVFRLCFDLPLWLVGDPQRPELSERFLK